MILEPLVNKAVLWTKPKPDHDVLDLFCGVGTFSIPLAQHAKTVTGVEENAEAFDGVAKTLSLMTPLKSIFLQGKAEQVLPQLRVGKYQLVVLDPPRRGLHPEAAESLIRLDIPKILYFVCNPPTMVRDLNLFWERAGN